MVMLLAGAFVGSAQAAGDATRTYCDVAREWAVHEIAGVDGSDPAAFRKYWGEYLVYVHQARKLAPERIRDDWRVNATAVREILTPLLEKYDFDLNLLYEIASDEEKALLDEPPADVQRAQLDILRFEGVHCGAQQPLPADVTFTGEKPGPYCKLVASDDKRVQALFQGGGHPADVMAYFLDRDRRKLDAKELAAAPEVIREDVRALVDWSAERQRPVLGRYGYDIRNLILDGSRKARAAFQLTDSEIRMHFARVAAYEQQVCPHPS